MRVNEYKTMLDINSQIAYLVKEKGFNYNYGNILLTQPDSIYNFMIEQYRLNEEAIEKVYMLAFNTKMKIIGTFKISEGTINASIFNPREIIQKALLTNASNIVMIHNHPSQDTAPSNDDISSTKRLKEACKIVGLNLCDHIIIGENYTSLKEKGYL